MGGGGGGGGIEEFFYRMAKSQQGRFTVIFALFRSRFCIKSEKVLIQLTYFHRFKRGLNLFFCTPC